MKSNKEYLLNKLETLEKKGMYFHGVKKTNVFPTEEIVKNTRDIIDSCTDDELIDWDVSLYSNGSTLLYYVERHSDDVKEHITACCNIAEAAVSGVFAYKEVYYTVTEKIDELDKFFNIFKKVKLYSDPKPSTQTLLKIFWMFDKHGLIKDDLCFDPEHFMETVIHEHWDNWDNELREYKSTNNLSN